MSVKAQSENEEAFFRSNRNATVTQKIRMVVSAKSNRRPWRWESQYSGSSSHDERGLRKEKRNVGLNAHSSEVPYQEAYKQVNSPMSTH